DRLLWQPGEGSAAAGGKLDADLRGRPERTIDLLGRRCADDKPRLISCRDIEVEAVAADNAARRVDEHRLKLSRAGAGEPHPQRARLVQAFTRGNAAAVFRGQRDAADRTVRGEDARTVFGEAHAGLPTASWPGLSRPSTPPGSPSHGK